MEENLVNIRDRYGSMLLAILLKRRRKNSFTTTISCDLQIPRVLERDSLGSDKARQMLGKCSFVVLSGFNGVGKDTIGKELARLGFPRLPNVTTRRRRNDEVEGVDYFFMTEEEFNHAREAGEFLTCKRRHGTDWHGFLRRPFVEKLAKGEGFHLDKSPISWLELLKCREIGEQNFCAFYILPPSFDEWLRRLTLRTQRVGVGESVINRLEDSLANFKIVEDNLDLYDIFVVNDRIERVVWIIRGFLK
ncbi:MAG: hypothetical protein AB1465_04870 [Patescibacteria group bacterium]